MTVLNWKLLAVLVFLNCQVSGFYFYFLHFCEMTASHSVQLFSVFSFRSLFFFFFTVIFIKSAMNENS